MGRTRTAAPWLRPTGRPLVVPGLIAINVVIFLITLTEATGGLAFYETPLFRLFALRRVDVAEGAWWQPLTSGFMHVGFIHLAFNMIALWMIGQVLEQVLGSLRFLVVYLVSLLGGSLAVLAFANPLVPTAGASGAVYGLMAGLVVVLLRTRMDSRPVLTIILLNVIISFAVPGISYIAHFGGLALGAAVTAAMRYPTTAR